VTRHRPCTGVTYPRSHTPYNPIHTVCAAAHTLCVPVGHVCTQSTLCSACKEKSRRRRSMSNPLVKSLIAAGQWPAPLSRTGCGDARITADLQPAYANVVPLRCPKIAPSHNRRQDARNQGERTAQ
jgi:hypothetical protein